MYTHFKERGMHKAYSSPKMGCSINHSKEPNKISSICIRGSRQSKWCAKQPRHTWIYKISKYKAQHIQTHTWYTTKTCKGASNLQYKYVRNKLPQGGTLDKRYGDNNTWLGFIKNNIWRSLNSSWGSQVSNALHTHLLIKFELVGPQPSWVLGG
jgi:hypothetical protein